MRESFVQRRPKNTTRASILRFSAAFEKPKVAHANVYVLLDSSWAMTVRLRAPWVGPRPSLRPQLHLHGRPPLTRNFHASGPNHIVHGTINTVAASLLIVHDLSGLPWALSIPITAMLFRIFTLPIYYIIFRNQRKMQMAEPLHEAYRYAWDIRAKELVKQGQEDAVQKVSLVRDRTGTMLSSSNFKYNHYLSMLFVTFLPLWLGGVAVLQTSCIIARAAPELATHEKISRIARLMSEGLLWFPDLTAFDPALCMIFGPLFVANAWLSVSPSSLLADTTLTVRAWAVFVSFIYRFMAVAGSAVAGLTFYSYHAPAAVMLFCLSSSLCAMVQRSVVKRIVFGGNNMIQPARAKSVLARKRWMDRSGSTQFAGSEGIPKGWDMIFSDRKLGPDPGLENRTPSTLKPARFRADLAPRPTQSAAQGLYRKG